MDADAIELQKAQRTIEALERAVSKQQARGHRVQFVLPPPGLKDMNDWLVAALEEAA